MPFGGEAEHEGVVADFPQRSESAGHLDDGQPYLAMEYVAGCDLRTVFQPCKQLMEGGAATMPKSRSA